MAKPSTFIFDGRTFVAGLIWQTQPQDSTKDDLRLLAEEIDCDLLVRRDEPPVQYGFASTAENSQIKKGIFSVAAIISKSMEVEGFRGNVLAAFEIPDSSQFILYAQRSHAILPLNGDLIGSEDEIYKTFSNLLSTGWDQILAPSHWGISDAAFRNIASFIPTKKGKITTHNWWQLRPVNEAPKTLKYLGIGVAVFVACAAGFYIYDTQSQAQSQNAERARLATEAEAAAKERKKAAMIALPHPWASMAKPLVVINACQQAIYAAPLSPAGWQMSGFSCDNGVATGVYERPSKGLTVAALKLKYPDMGISPNGENATFRRQVDIACCDPEEEVISRVEVLTNLIAFAQSLELKSMPVEEPPAALPQADPNIPSIQPDWTEFKWSYVVVGSPRAMIEAMNMPGIRVEKLSFTPKSGVWSMEGRIYAQAK